MSKAKRKYLVIFLVIIAGIVAFLWIRSYVFSRLGVSLHDRITSLSLSGFNVRYDSIHIDWIGNSISVENLVVEKNAYDTTCVYPEFISSKRVIAEGIGIFNLIFGNKLSLDRIEMDSLQVLMRENSLMQLDSATRKRNEFTLDTDYVGIRYAQFTYLDSACATITDVKSHLTLTGLKLDFHEDRPFSYEASHLTLDSINLEMPEHHYAFKVLRADLNFPGEALRIDSVKVIPQLSKTAFGREYGYEIDRFEATIPFIKVDGFKFSADSARVRARAGDIQFYLKVFRDKRLPFVKVKKLLPVAMLHDLQIALVIDSLKVTNSYVQYEEFAEDTSEPGIVYFDNLFATILNIDNKARKGSAELTARARLQGKGDLSLHVKFPLEAEKRASVRGAIRDFPIPEINSMLTPATQLKVESGNMRELSFRFTFNAIRSDGEIELNYEDLKVISFKDEEKQKGDEPQKDNLKTFIMNTFIFKKDMDEDVPEEKRTGTVQYNRDEYRSVFNFWVKSLVSGIKSAYDLEKREARSEGKELRKERREERRLARKAKRAEKKRERG